MNGTISLLCVSALLLVSVHVATAQANPLPDGVSIQFGETDEPHGLLFRTPDDQCQRLEVKGRPCRATDHASKRWVLAFATDPDFKIEGRDTISVISEYLDNGHGPIYIQYVGRDGGTAGPVERGGTGEWRIGRWQITDPAFAQTDGHGIKFQFTGEGWFGTADLHLASVRVTHEAVRLTPARVIVPADGQTTTSFAVDAFDVSGEPVADGTEIALTCDGASTPPSVVTRDGHATFDVTSGPERGTVRLDARLADVSGGALLYQVVGDGALFEFTHGVAAEDLRTSIRFGGREAERIEVIEPEEGDDPDVVEIRLAFPPEGQRARALLRMGLAIPGKPQTLRFDVGSDGSLTQLNVLLGDMDGDLFLYGVYSGGDGTLDGWHTKEIDVNRLGMCYGPDMDRVLELPLTWHTLSLHFAPGTTEGVIFIRRMEADCVGTMTEAQHVAGRVRELRTDPVMIEGVPQMGSAVGQYCRGISAVTGALRALGCDATYEELMTASGAAFAIAWWPGRYHYRVIENSPENLVVNAAVAAGASAKRVEFATPGAAWEAMRQSIDEGRPVVAPYFWGSRIIYGYDPDDKCVYTQSNNTPPDKPEVVDWAKLCATGLPGRPLSLVLIDYDPVVAPPERQLVAILKWAVAFADWPREQKLDGTLTFGLAAYDDWAETVRAGAGEAPVSLAVDLTWFFAARIADKRRCAAAILAEDAWLHESFAEAAEHYSAVAETLDTMGQALAAGGPVTRAAAQENFSDPDVREAAAVLIEQAKAAETEAVDALRVALADLAGAAAEAEEQ